MTSLPACPQVQQQRLLVDQLRREAVVSRIAVSQVQTTPTSHLPPHQACKDLQRFCLEHQQEDLLLTGFPSQKMNPFREKSTCTLL